MADETWTAAGAPHLISSDLRVTATVTIEKCATVKLGERTRVTVGTSSLAGKLVARGVTFSAQDPGKPWGSLTVDVKGALDFENTQIEGGANPASAQNGGGAVVAYGIAASQPVITRSLRFVNVLVTGAKGYGVNLQRMSGFTADSANVTFAETGDAAAPYPVRVEAGAVGTLPTLTFRNTMSGDIRVERGGSMPSDTFKALGVPYRIMGRLLVAPSADGAPSTLTIEAGVTLKMDHDGDSGMTLGLSPARRGVLIVNGTANAPVVFTSAKAVPAAADWTNLYFRFTPATGNRITFAIVEYAGAASGLQGYGCGPAGNNASVIIAPDTGRPDSAFITDSTLRQGGGDTGLLLGWVSDLTGPDFVSSNTFSDLPACKVSRWRSATGNACPGSTGGAPVCLL